MSVNEKMTAIANEVRTLSGTFDKLNLDDMAFHTKDTNAEVETQEDLIQQITTALQGKSAVGTTEVWTLTLEDGTEITKEVVIV